MAEKESKNYFQFDGTNYNNWKYRIRIVLEDKDLLQYVEEDLEVITLYEPDREYNRHLKKDKKCKAILVQHISDSQLEYIKDKQTAKEIFDALEQVFERKSIASRLYLRKKFVNMKYDESVHMKNHLLEFDKIVRELKSTGSKIDDIDVVCQLLLSLPKSYDSLVTAIETLKLESLDMDFVRNRLLDEYCKRNGEKETTNSSRSYEGAGAMAAFKYKCYNCGKLGHKRTECPTSCNCNKEKEANDSTVTKTANVAYPRGDGDTGL